MSNIPETYWHIQMNRPWGKKGGTIDSRPMLIEPQPVIGTGEWEDKRNQCRMFKEIPNGAIILVREGNTAMRSVA